MRVTRSAWMRVTRFFQSKCQSGKTTPGSREMKPAPRAAAPPLEAHGEEKRNP